MNAFILVTDEARRQRAADRLAVHVYDPERCKPGCPKRPQA